MSGTVVHTFVVLLVMLEGAVPAAAATAMTAARTQFDFSDPATLADLVNGIGKEFGISLLSINYNSANVDPTYLSEFLVKLNQDGNTYFANRAQVVGTELSRMRQRHVLNLYSLVVAFVANSTDELLNVLAVNMRGHRACYTLFVVQHLEGNAEIEAFFNFLWSKRFRRPMMIANNRDVLSIAPYPKVTVVNNTLAPIQKYFSPPRQRWNFLGYKVRVPVQVDVPNVFWYRRHRDGHCHIDGIGGTLFRKFMDYVNATFEPYPLIINGSQFLHMTTIVQMLREGDIEISPHLHTTDNTEPEIDYSYPFIITPRCFMIPLDNEISRNLYLLLPFKWSLWALIIGQIILMDLCFRLWLKYKKQCESVIARTGGVGLIALCVILALPNQALKSFNACKAVCPRLLRFLICYGIVAFSGAYLSQIYSSTLTSILTATLFGTPHVSEADLMKHDKPIMILKEDEIPLFGSAKFNWDYKSRLLFSRQEEFFRNRYSMNISNIYPVSLLRWNFLNQQQRFLKRKGFSISDVCAGQFPLQYQMQSDSHFDKPLMYFILKSYEGGLVSYWTGNTFRKAVEMGYIRYFKDTDDFIDRDHIKGISMKALSPLFYLYGLGVTLSSIVFMTELAYTKMKAKLLKADKYPGK